MRVFITLCRRQHQTVSIPEESVGDISGRVDLDVERISASARLTGGGDDAATCEQTGEQAERADRDDGVIAGRQEGHVVHLVHAVCGNREMMV